MVKLHKLFKLPLLKINITNLIQKVLFEYNFIISEIIKML